MSSFIGQVVLGERNSRESFRYLDTAAFIKAKINNSGVLSLGYTQALRPGVRASFGLAVDTNKLNGAHETHAHKIGASFTFEG